MSFVVGISIAAYVTLGLFHWLAACYFSRWLRARGRQADSDCTDTKGVNADEKIAILIAARGFDPSLAPMLQAVLSQDLANFEVHIVVDSSDQNADQQIRQLVADHPLHDQLKIHFLREPLTSCGLKNSALLTAYRQIADDVKILALIDTDIVPPSSWLRSLVAPLRESGIGAVTGAQWFEPIGDWQPGTLVRCLWNAAALVPSCMFANAWAGSLAIRRETFERAGLPELWTRTIVDDGPIPQALARLGLRMHFASELILVNRESCSLAFVHNYLARMLRWSRLYETSFRNTLLHAVASSAMWMAILIGFFWILATGKWGWGVGWLIGIVLGNGLNVFGWRQVRNAVKLSSPWTARQLQNAPRTITWVYLAALVPPTQWGFCWSAFKAIFFRTISWRGAEYRIDGPEQVRLVRRSAVGSLHQPAKSSI